MELWVVTWQKMPQSTMPKKVVCDGQGVPALGVVWMHPHNRNGGCGYGQQITPSAEFPAGF